MIDIVISPCVAKNIIAVSIGQVVIPASSTELRYTVKTTYTVPCIGVCSKSTVWDRTAGATDTAASTTLNNIRQ